ncbi:hypothetical protein HYH03_016533 [Edaphochlamys debaryana]|uniref:Uncharacterized protein n=1 Tax=Edaphochlamys debaryana TaxID=47281 RepID=A0A836BQ28_9CHLO|nr:hypothetical protein HYH03_016533 [Edaphochlamys debaryana]|eukprot:KAG2484705.1 hypothetical protein HYH03_016533 [Edaphochlamys debaryana]
MSQALEQKLLALGYNADVSKACAELFGNFEEAKPYLGPGPSLLASKDIKEYYSLKYHRYYYATEGAPTTSWEFPPHLQLSEWMLDAGISGLPLAACRRLLSAVVWAVQTNAHKGERLWSALGLLGRLTANIVDCGNALEKYRTVRKGNPKILEALDCLGGSGEAVLRAAGFVEARGQAGAGGDCLLFPPEGADLRPITLINAKLHQLTSRKGFTGMARDSDDTGESSRSRHSGLPGFAYQKEIHECSCCGRPINDGTDRLVTRRFDCPKGEFRYECDKCQGYNLCETCWDKYQAGNLQPPHPREHPFRTHHPHASQHGLNANETASNPWGVLISGGSAARARERLKQRTGL